MSAKPSDIYHQQQRDRRERIASAILGGMAAGGGLPSDPSLRSAVLDKVMAYTDGLITRLVL